MERRAGITGKGDVTTAVQLRRHSCPHRQENSFPYQDISSDWGTLASRTLPLQIKMAPKGSENKIVIGTTAHKSSLGPAC